MELLYRRPILREPSLPSAKSFSTTDYDDSESVASQQYDGTAEGSSIMGAGAGAVNDVISWYGCSQRSGPQSSSSFVTNPWASGTGTDGSQYDEPLSYEESPPQAASWDTESSVLGSLNASILSGPDEVRDLYEAGAALGVPLQHIRGQLAVLQSRMPGAPPLAQPSSSREPPHTLRKPHHRKSFPTSPRLARKSSTYLRKQLKYLGERDLIHHQEGVEIFRAQQAHQVILDCNRERSELWRAARQEHKEKIKLEMMDRKRQARECIVAWNTDVEEHWQGSWYRRHLVRVHEYVLSDLGPQFFKLKTSDSWGS